MSAYGLYGIEKFKLSRYEKLIQEIVNCKNIDSAVLLIVEAEKEIALYSKGFEDGRPKPLGPYGDR
jgi:hypothetical protein